MRPALWAAARLGPLAPAAALVYQVRPPIQPSGTHSLRGLPISLPSTTGVPHPLTGSVLAGA